MKTILPWLLAVLAIGSAVFLYQTSQTKTTELAQLQQQVQEVDAIREENDTLKKSQVAPEELARLRESQDELLRLRNEVRQLRADKTQLGQQAQAAKTAAEQAQAQIQAAQVKMAEVSAQAAAERQAAIAAARPAPIDPAQVRGCLNNLRQIDAAKQMWALDQRKPAEATPTEQDLAAFLAGQTIPLCPGGGKYTFGNLSVAPACSIPGHAVSPQ